MVAASNFCSYFGGKVNEDNDQMVGGMGWELSHKAVVTFILVITFHSGLWTR